jgi:hypothetical protein
MTTKKNRAPKDLPEEAFDRMIGVLDGPLNKGLEKVMKNRVVLAPLGLSMTLSMKALAMVRRTMTGERRPDRSDREGGAR